MYQAKSGVKNFSLYWEGWGGVGSLDKKFFFQSEHVSSQIWCQNFFPLLEGTGYLDKKIFFQSEHVSSQTWCQKFFPLLRPPLPGPGPGTPPPTWTWDPPYLDLGPPPPPKCGQTENITSRHPSDAGGYNDVRYLYSVF